MAKLHTRLLSTIDQVRASLDAGDRDGAAYLLEVAIETIVEVTGETVPDGEGELIGDQP